ncbi:hypothetical protein PAXINDRAFT_16438 [Paxillus involutus ATCC 200175]|uniref:Uncharacterized protein n=1 Tax=Paxillus involutus ATCC 200175 TaxID=664439 RepID=A0A0C9TS18_PAXIN|nr:hypothetical protein PAXINDRAFT_16438 [Paxillus involutus ATCC 200175]
MTDPVPPDFEPGKLAAALGNHPEPLHRKFVELYEGCSEVFPSGKTFMDLFREDRYADERRENLYFPWASKEEWAFASWLLCSRLSMAAIDTLLSLKIFKHVSLSFHTAKELRAQAETLPAGPCWLCQPMTPEHPTKKPDWLVHQALNIMLAPLKTAAAVEIMMSDPVGNLCYCCTPLVSYITDTPEESLLAATGTKASPITMATSKEFGDNYCHPPHTPEITLAAIHTACAHYPPTDYKNFLKAIKLLRLNGVVKPFWKDWALSEPSDFLKPKPLHHFHHMFWDYYAKWCIAVVGASGLGFHFSIIQTLVAYQAFDEGISKLKQVTGRDHRTVQCYIVGAITGSIPWKLLVTICALLDFHYLAQAPSFTNQSLERVASALKEFHDNKEAVLHTGT